jgi:hypothetical protein
VKHRDCRVGHSPGERFWARSEMPARCRRSLRLVALAGTTTALGGTASNEFTRIPVLLRNQTRFWVLFRAAAKNKLERDAMWHPGASEVGASVAEDDFLRMWEACGDKPWNFMVVSIRSPMRRMFRREFQAYLVPEGDEASPLAPSPSKDPDADSRR